MSELCVETQSITSRLDSAFAEFLSQRTTLNGTSKQQLKTLLISLSQQINQGHSCMPVNEAEIMLLVSSGLTNDNPTPSTQNFPLILEGNKLYLQRYWSYEKRLAEQIKKVAATNTPIENIDLLLNRYFANHSDDIRWQREAAKKALQQALCIITGGPGTGKTSTVCKILALLQELADEPLAIALAAPTGKAAMRLQEAICDNLSQLNCTEDVKNKIPQSATTIHRLLGSKPPSPYFTHDAGNPLLYDVVVVDEASMIDLALMSKLLDALKPNSRLIMLGDKDQLTSVESGAVLADLIRALPKNTVELKYAFRFDSEIKKFADAVNQQDGDLAWGMISTAANHVSLIQPQHLVEYIIKQREEYAVLVKNDVDFNRIYSSFNKFQVLCANRLGNQGALAISRLIERQLFQHAIQRNVSSWYVGRPVMVLQNNLSLGLYNGDIGICLPDQAMNGNLAVFFQRPDGGVKKYLPLRLPLCETVFAMTIHKSQGSEFDEVLIVLPETLSPVLSKELLYTGITRAKNAVKLRADQAIFKATINKKIIRSSGLSARVLA